MAASLNITLSPETVYATKGNIAYPGTSSQATAAESTAETRMNDALPAKVTVSVSSGAIVVAD